jgi:Na+-translocating ferredoxin:NAD+ oxidoreductase RnfG subunit
MSRWPAFLAAPLAVVAPAALATVYLSAEQAQQAMFPGAVLTAVEGDFSKARIWSVSGGGWFIVDEVLGKHEFITYAVGLDADGSVRGVEILVYLESHGGEIRNAEWRRQFIGKTAAAPLRLDHDIRNISGATLSCRHVTDGIQRLLALHETILKRH